MAGVDWVNSDGLLVRYGPNQGQRGNKTGVTMGAGRVRELNMLLDLTKPQGAGGVLYSADRNGDGVVDGFSGLDTVIPNGALVLGENAIVKVAPAGGTNYSIGTFALNGTAINAAGIRTTGGADGALVGTQVGQDSYVAATVSGTYTAGLIEIVIRYVV